MTNEAKRREESKLTDLLACPFCGGEAKRNDDKQNWGDIFCADCGCHMAEGSMDKAIESWNKRAHHWTYIPTIEDYMPDDELTG